MIKWYEDNNLSIQFDHTPDVCMRIITPSMTQKEKQNITKYPFLNKSDLRVKLIDFRIAKTYEFLIEKDFCWDGATIPRLFWRLIGSKTDPRFLIPSLIHDVLCENHSFVDNNRYFADKVFERLLYVSGVCAFNRWLIFHSVDNFQKFCGWHKNNNSLDRYIESDN